MCCHPILRERDSDQFLDSIVFEGIEGHFSLFPISYETHPMEEAQMVGRGSYRRINDVRQIADA